MRLLLVEDDERVAAALVAVLGRHGFQVRHARSGHEALDALVPDGNDPYRVVLLDLGLPDRDGFEVCSRIRAGSGVPVIMVTARADIRSRIHGLNLGADDYVTKPYDMGELLARIHAVARRGAAPAAAAVAVDDDALPAPRGPLESRGIRIDRERRRVSVDGRDVPLTRKEFDLLALLAQSPGVVYRREQIFSEVWRSGWEGNGRTLEVHIGSLRTKLALPGLVEAVRGVGYRLIPESPAAAPAPGASPSAPATGTPPNAPEH
ncbi:DNA-binding response regulator [Kitasatospora herbaricolor]|uniref:response regulator transcription factor n=1 Tax=Kitasatospora herbaricolor TaxID=68217 RepID=UPI0017499529|nr:response regulator transcription factor [Kitasatospora herbaricolor]MDQ0310856.1 DNA-binding response OmpR family regulator [Kitasatospora herbaricolor]GGV28370.1 DNA-binding response regulator [Kitasatospora herbaricolor]